MKIIMSLFALSFSLSFVACTKSDSASGSPVIVPDSTRLVGMITNRTSRNGYSSSDSITIQYDDQNRITALLNINTGLPFEKYLYNPDSTVTVQSYNPYTGASFITQETIITTTDDGKTVIWTIQVGVGTSRVDTTVLTHKFENGIIQQEDVFVASEGRYYNYSYVYHYSAANETTFFSRIDLEDTDPSTKIEITQADDKQNPIARVSPINYSILCQHIPFPLNAQGIHNPVAFDWQELFPGQAVQITARATYNSSGYPVTYEMSNPEFGRAEFSYAPE